MGQHWQPVVAQGPLPTLLTHPAPCSVLGPELQSHGGRLAERGMPRQNGPGGPILPWPLLDHRSQAPGPHLFRRCLPQRPRLPPAVARPRRAAVGPCEHRTGQATPVHTPSNTPIFPLEITGISKAPPPHLAWLSLPRPSPPGRGPPGVRGRLATPPRPSSLEPVPSSLRATGPAPLGLCRKSLSAGFHLPQV